MGCLLPQTHLPKGGKIVLVTDGVVISTAVSSRKDKPPLENFSLEAEKPKDVVVETTKSPLKGGFPIETVLAVLGGKITAEEMREMRED